MEILIREKIVHCGWEDNVIALFVINGDKSDKR